MAKSRLTEIVPSRTSAFAGKPIGLYLDDIRNPTTLQYNWIICRDVESAKKWMTKNGCPVYITFDHDLGDEQKPTGYDLAKWMIEQDVLHSAFFPVNFKFNVHSANPVGVKNITELLNKYLEQIG